MLAILHNGRRIDLEDPLFVRLINCVSDQHREAFVKRFGEIPTPSSAFRDALERTAALLLEPSLGSPEIKATFQLDVANAYLLNDVLISPRLLAVRGGALRFVLETPDLAAFMALELATAVEVGAMTKRCEHCNKLFLHGPTTKRRSSAKYCMDLCRAAAARARNSPGGNEQ